MKIQFKLTAFLLILSVLLSIICMPIAALEADPAASDVGTDASLSDPFALNPEPIETEDQIFERLTADSFLLNYIDEAAFRAAGHINRLPEEEDLSSYVFENEDGTRTAYILNEPVKYIDSTGAVREKDLTLSHGQMGNASVMATGVNTEAYTITATNTPMTFPGNLTHGVHFTYGGYTITLRPETVNPSTVAMQAEGKVLYRNAFGSTAHLMYTPQLNGLKEDIVLTRYSTQNSFTFILNTDGMSVARDAGGCYLYDGTDEEAKLRLGQVISYDANGDFSIGEMTVTHQSGNTYTVTLTVDLDFLENAFYPVTVDPTFTVIDGEISNSAIEDIVVFQGDPNTVYTSMQYNTVGYSSSLGVGMTAFRLMGVYLHNAFTTPGQYDITSVKFHVWDYNGASQAVTLHPLLNNTTWNEWNATWNNIGSYGPAVSSAVLANNAKATFDITELVECWQSETYNKDAGFVLVGNPSVAKKIYSCEHTNTQRRPYVQLNYNYSIISPGAFAVAIGQTKEIPVSIYPSSYTVEWTTENASVATIDQAGNVVGVTLGVTNLNGVITFTDDGTTANCSIEVHVILLAEQQYFLQNKSTVYVEPNDTSDPNYNQITEKFVELITDEAGNFSVAQTYWEGGVSQRWELIYDTTYECYKFRSLYQPVGTSKKYLALTSNTIISQTTATAADGTYYARWKIQLSNSGAYVIKNYIHKDTSYVLAMGGAVDPDSKPNDSGTYEYPGDKLVLASYTADGAYNDDGTYHDEWILQPVYATLPTSGSELAYNPGIWNDGGEIQATTNCYAYAFNTQIEPDDVNENSGYTGGYIMYPGISTGTTENYSMYTEYDHNRHILNFSLIKRIESDAVAYGFAFRKIGRFDVCSPGCYKVALVVQLGAGCHWYRQNPDGSWSQKNGGERVTMITEMDPLIENREQFTEFIGYFEVTPINALIGGNT